MTVLSRPVELLMAKAIIGPFIKLALMILRKAISEGEKRNEKLEGKIQSEKLYCFVITFMSCITKVVDDFLSEIETHF